MISTSKKTGESPLRAPKNHGGRRGAGFTWISSRIVIDPSLALNKAAMMASLLPHTLQLQKHTAPYQIDAFESFQNQGPIIIVGLITRTTSKWSPQFSETAICHGGIRDPLKATSCSAAAITEGRLVVIHRILAAAVRGIPCADHELGGVLRTTGPAAQELKLGDKN